MPNNTHDLLRSIVANVRCKPGWWFDLIDDPDEGLRLNIIMFALNARDMTNQLRISHFFPVPMATYNEKTWRRWIFERCRDVETHEIGEFFMVGDERPFAPLHGPGENPYCVHEFRPEVDALTTQDGTVVR